MGGSSSIEQLRGKLRKALERPTPDFGQILELSSRLAALDPDNVRFTTDAALISRLGKELVARQETAVSELIKNAYDADATAVSLTFAGGYRPGGRLRVCDNGSGMTRQELIDGFMRLASSEKLHRPVSPRFARKRAGRKGIGRFAAQRLGNRLTITTQTESAAKALRISIDWSQFEADRDLLLIANPIEEIAAASPGTTLIIDGLREGWSEAQITRVYRYVEELIQPFPLSRVASKHAPLADPGFRVTISRMEGAKEVPIASEQEMIFDYALAKVTGSISSNGIGKWHIESDRLNLDEGGTIIADEEAGRTAFRNVRNVAFSAHYFIWLSEYLPAHQLTRLRSLAQTRGGIRAYRNGFRVPPYGERGNDWLRLDETSRKRGSVLSSIANNNWFGFVEINEPDTDKFDETSSREGLMQTAAYDELVQFVFESLRAAVLRVEAVRGRGKKKSQQTSKVTQTDDAPLDERLEHAAREVYEVLKLLESSSRSDKNAVQAAEQLREVVNALRSASPETADILEELSMLRVLASLGLTIGMFTHEISTRLAAMRARIRTVMKQAMSDAEAARGIQKIDDHFRMLEAYASYFDATIAANVQRELEPIDLREVVADFIREFEPVAKRRNVEFVTPDFEGDVITRPMHRSEWGSILANFFTNSLKAIRRGAHRSSGRLLIHARREGDAVVMDFVDNGDGIPPKNAGRIFDAFFTTSSSARAGAADDELTGSGLGLKIVRDIVSAARGEVVVAPAPAGYTTCLRVRVPANKQ